MKQSLKDFRCKHCNTLLFKYSVSEDIITIEVKCPRCNSFDILEINLAYLIMKAEEFKKNEDQKSIS